jgi:hypothetical protein
MYYYTYLTGMSDTLPIDSKPKTKKQMIRMMLDQGDRTDEEIARLAGTTTANVYKEKSHYAKETGKKFTVTKEQTNIKTTSSSTGSGEITTTTLMTKKLSVEFEHNQHVVVPPLNQEQLCILYTAFDEGKDPTHIIAEHGLNPEAVEIEYRRYLRIKKCIPIGIVEKILDALPPGDPAYENIKKKLIETKELDYQALKDALSANDSYQMIQGVNILLGEFLMNREFPLPKSVSRPLCTLCGLPVSGIIYFNHELIKWQFDTSYLICEMCVKRRGYGK